MAQSRTFRLRVHRHLSSFSRVVISVFIALLLITQSALPGVASPPHLGEPSIRLDSFPAQWGYQNPEPYYANVLSGYKARGYTSAQGVRLDRAGPDYSAQSDSTLTIEENLGGLQGAVLAWYEGQTGTGWVEWAFDVPSAGLYNLAIEYYPLPGKRASIQRDLQIDGQYPFIEARRLSFDRTWKDAHPPARDNQGNDIRPSQVEAPQWRFQLFEDALAMYRETLKIDDKDTAALNGVGACLMTLYLEPGTHDVSMREEALASWRKSVQIKPEQTAIIDLISRYQK